MFILTTKITKGNKDKKNIFVFLRVLRGEKFFTTKSTKLTIKRLIRGKKRFCQNSDMVILVFPKSPDT